MILLALETSCDETSAAVVRDGSVLANVVSSQIKLHAEYGGVVPELAVREHLRLLVPVTQTALREANVTAAQLDAAAATRYPVFYLLHGYSDDADAWTSVGKANVILDNLIANGAAKPMIVAMPLGYGAREIVQAGARDEALYRRNTEMFSEMLMGEVVPLVERSYKTATDRSSRAVAGLSMGGFESLHAGLHHLDHFAWLGAFSSGLRDDFAARLDVSANDVNGQLRVFWIACGTEDRLHDVNAQLRSWLTSRGIHHTAIDTPGAHTWMVWRRNLAAFAPLLFR